MYGTTFDYFCLIFFLHPNYPNSLSESVEINCLQILCGCVPPSSLTFHCCENTGGGTGFSGRGMHVACCFRQSVLMLRTAHVHARVHGRLSLMRVFSMWPVVDVFVCLTRITVVCKNIGCATRKHQLASRLGPRACKYVMHAATRLTAGRGLPPYPLPVPKHELYAYCRGHWMARRTPATHACVIFQRLNCGWSTMTKCMCRMASHSFLHPWYYPGLHIEIPTLSCA